MADMSDSPDQSTETTGPVPAQPAAPPPPERTTAVAPPPPYKPYKHSRLNQVAAWVGIVAGSVFIVAVIFGTGFVLGAHSGDRGFDRHEAVMFKHRPEPAFQRGPMGEFERGPFVFRGPNFPAPPPGAPGAPAVPGAPGTPAPARP
jgi:hypothetical protein